VEKMDLENIVGMAKVDNNTTSRIKDAEQAIEYGTKAAKYGAAAGQAYGRAHKAFQASVYHIGQAYLWDRKNKAKHVETARTSAQTVVPDAISATRDMALGLVYGLAAYYLAKQVLAPKTEKPAYNAMPALQPA
jgi:hypothetical protein